MKLVIAKKTSQCLKKIQYIWEYFLHLRDPNKKVKKCKDRKEAIGAIEAKAKSGVKLNKIKRAKLTSQENAQTHSKKVNYDLSDIRARKSRVNLLVLKNKND